MEVAIREICVRQDGRQKIVLNRNAAANSPTLLLHPEPVRTGCPRAILCASDALLRVARNQELGLPTFLSCIAAGNRSIALRR
jgi:hypothetical protein